MKSKLWPTLLGLSLSYSALAQVGPQSSPSMPSPNNDEMSDYQNPLPNEGNGTSTWSDRQAQEDRNFNKNRDYDREERNGDLDEQQDEGYDESDEVELDE